MALVVRATGNVINATDPNQYHDLLTGVMTDQPVTLNIGSGTSPLLTLKGSAAVDRLQVLDTAGALQFKVTSGGLPQDGSGHNYPVMVATTGTVGRQIFVGTTTPTGANEGDIWVKA